MPPNTSNRLAPMAGNVAAILAGVVVVAISLAIAAKLVLGRHGSLRLRSGQAL